MPNYNLPQAPSNPNQPIPNDPFYAVDSGKPYLEGPYSPILIGAGIEICGDYIYSPSGEIPIPIGYLTSQGALISATGPALPSTIQLGLQGQFLTVDLSEPTGIKWADAPTAVGCVSCTSFIGKGSLLSATAPATPTALPVGASGSVLAVNSSTPTGLEWVPNPYPTFTQKGQIVASCAAGCALTVSGTDGDILYFLNTNPAGWGAVQGCALFIPQEGFEKGTLVVGSGQNTSEKLPAGGDNYVLTADSTCALGVKWQSFSQNAQQTNGQEVTIPSSTPSVPITELLASSFPAGSQVFVSMTGSWYGEDEPNCGCFYMKQGSTCSYPVNYSNESAGLIPSTYDNKYPFNLSFVIPSWDASFNSNLALVVHKANTNPLTVQVQTSAFILKV